MIAALFVDPGGCYAGVPDVDLWGESRDARLYDGPYPVCVEQGHYGHRARKPTWLYSVRTPLPSLKWGRGPGERMALGGAGYHSAAERRAAAEAGTLRTGGRMSKRARSATPPEFRDVLVGLSRSVK